ncbi:MAG: menaquinol oxidoreductase [candidate division Zixibacteria bacterium]|nr:menaquinol oxidoreductase [candidate division Zixibacteria bacterium]
MGIFYGFVAVVALVLLVIFGVGALGLDTLFAVVIPYAAIALFLIGFAYRVFKWAKSPVPYKITTTCGQQKSLPWIKNNKLDCPHSTWAVIGRMALEVLFFRSLFRNTKSELKSGPKLVHGDEKYLWLGALAFHWSFLIVFARHYRFFTNWECSVMTLVNNLDSFFQIGLPMLYMTDLILVGAVTFLFLRRVLSPQLRYISLAADYFPLFLIFGIAASGILMRYFMRVDIVEIKNLAMGLVGFNPAVPEGLGIIFYIHLFLVSVLFAYFPFSKLMHMPGVFMSPTRNMANDNRARRHINPQNPEVKIHTYEEYEDEFRDVMKASGLPLDKEE